jgi:hypothetical protein
VIEAVPEKGFVRLRVECVNAEGKAVLRGEVSGFPGQHEE